MSAEVRLRVLSTSGAPGLGLVALSAVCLLWAGMVLGVSFLEAPVKFRAPSLTLAVALDVGRHVFGAFNRVELAWGLAAIALGLTARPERSTAIALGVALGVLALQTLWLLPVLDRRVGLILAGATTAPAPYHVVYVALEALKLAALAVAGVRCLLALARGA